MKICLAAKTRAFGSRQRGMTLMETMIAIGVSAFIFAMLGFLIFFSARNTLNIHEQIMSQTNAAAASERLTQELRSASHFEKFATDNGALLLRLRYVVPQPKGNPLTRAVAYTSATKQIAIYEDADAFEANPKIKPLHKFDHINDFTITWQSQFWIRTRTFYSYHGFALRHSNPGNQLLGQFVTDIFTQRIYKFGA